MAKSKEELLELKEEYETLNEKLKELTEDELMQVTGGTGSVTYKYQFRDNDNVYLNEAHNDIFLITENVDTNDGSYKVQGRRRSPGKIQTGGVFSMSASSLLKCYKEIGGHLHALED